MVTDGRNEKKIVGGREMLSFIRSAFAFQDRVLLYLNEIPTECVIIAFNDQDLRNAELDRDIEITLPKTLFHSSAHEGQEFGLEIILDSAKLRLHCKLLTIRSNSLVIRLPKNGTIHQTRNSNRFSLSEQDWSDALIFSENQATPCVFKINDFSSGGIGITVGTTVKLETLTSELKIEGDLLTDHYHFKGPYRIQRIQLLKESESYFEYNLGLIETSRSIEKNASNRAGRHVVDSSIQLHVKATNTKLNVRISDVSTSGFRAIVPNQSMPGIAKDLVAIEASSQIKFKITRISENNSVAFQLLSQEPNDQIKWLNLIMPFLSNGRIDVNVVDSRSLVNLFFEAGASIVDGLEYKRFRLTQKNALSLLTNQSDVLIRWVNISENGTLLGHHSTYRVGLNSWYTGDVVGGQTNTNKADRNFFNDNFRILKDTIECFQTKQKILGSWKPNHPYWQTWRNFLIENSLTYCLQMCDSVTRNKILPMAEFSEKDNALTSIQPQDLFHSINNLKSDHQWFLGSMDIFPSGDSAEGTKELYLKNGHKGFKRSIKKITCKGKEYLVLLSQLPAGISINPNFDSAFIFPLFNDSISDLERDYLYSSVIFRASQAGFRISSLRFFSEKVNYIGTPTEFFVIDSRGLEVFK